MSAPVTPLPRVEIDDAGWPTRAFIPSVSQSVVHELERSIGGHWQHVNTSCRGWVEYGRCVHIEALEARDMSDETAITTITVNPLALLDDVDLDEIMASKLTVTAKHIYSFRQKGDLVEGVSIDGVRDAARALSTKGEAIREQWVRLEREDDRDAYFIACAARYAVAPDGREICMDTAIRAKRQPKWRKKREPKPDEPPEYFIDAWYEIGVAKAVRNATEALLPESLKDHIKAKARELLRGNGASAQAQAPANSRPAARVSAPPPLRAAGEPPYHIQVQHLITEMRETQDETFVSRAYLSLSKQFPNAFTVDGRYTPSGISESDAADLARKMRAQLHGEPPPPTEAPADAPEGQATAFDA